MKIGRNNPCPCGSGKKYKKCHLQQTKIVVVDPKKIKDHRHSSETFDPECSMCVMLDKAVKGGEVNA